MPWRSTPARACAFETNPFWHFRQHFLLCDLHEAFIPTGAVCEHEHPTPAYNGLRRSKVAPRSDVTARTATGIEAGRTRKARLIETHLSLRRQSGRPAWAVATEILRGA